MRQALKRADLKLLPSLLTEQVFNLNGGRSGLRALMAARQPPTAIFCGNDLLATGALLEAQRMGIKVPRQLSICGIDNNELAEAINPGLTTIAPAHTGSRPYHRQRRTVGHCRRSDCRPVPAAV